MKLDVIIVRLLPIVLYFFIGVSIFLCYKGIDIGDYYYIHSNSVIYSTSLFIISLSNKKYHCIYNRACYIMLFIIPLFNFLDARFSFVPNNMDYIWTVLSIYCLGLLATLYLSIRHFIQVKRIRHAKSKRTAYKTA